MTEFAQGYLQELEDHAALAATAKPFVLEGVQTFAAPKSISHRGWRKPPKNQTQVGRCSGASRASGEETLNYIATGGQIVKFSMDYAYAENQKFCGLYGKGDTGATINGSMEASRNTGIVLESVMPQSPTYNPNIPAGAEAIGKQHLIQSHSIIKSYDEAYKWLASGVGVILIGITWTAKLSQAGKRITMADMFGKPSGGHALLWEGFNEAGDIDMENSWGETWGDGGWSFVAPEVVDYWAQNGATLIGISDLQSYGYRQIKTWGEQFG